MKAIMQCILCSAGDKQISGLYFCSPACALQWSLNLPLNDPAWGEVLAPVVASDAGGILASCCPESPPDPLSPEDRAECDRIVAGFHRRYGPKNPFYSSPD